MLNLIEELFSWTPLLNVVYFTLAYLICFFLIPFIIKKAHEKQWVDQPNERKLHKQAIPTMGGMAIIAATLIIGIGLLVFQEFSYGVLSIIVGIIVLTITGMIDDLKDISAKKRLIVQFAVAALVVNSGFGFESILGIIDLPQWILSGISIVLIIGFINAFNFIDGIDGLAGGIGFISCMTLGFLFSPSVYGYLAFAMAGGLFAFLYYNFNPAKIFMGDTGSTVIGFMIAVLAIKLTTLPYVNIPANPHLLAFSLLMIPVFDIFRTIFFRVLKKNSPFSADKTHIHHLLIKTGHDHKKASIMLYVIHLFIIGFAIYLGPGINPFYAIVGLFVFCISLTEILGIYKLMLVKDRLKGAELKVAEVAYENVFLERNI